MTKTTDQILENLFSVIIGTVSEGTSDNYATMVIEKFIGNSNDEVAKYIQIRSNKVVVDKKINDVDLGKVSGFLSTLVNSIFSKLFRHIIRKKMKNDLYEDLKRLGVHI